MKEVLPKINVKYTGGDIVDQVIESNRVNYSSDRNNFVSINIIDDKLPASDLMICRDCLFHFSDSDIRKFLNNFVNSDIKYLLTTTHMCPYNQDVETGGYRSLNLFESPWNFTNDYLYSIEDWIPGFEPRWMCLWSRDQVAKFCARTESC
jgi:hypothetical protein